MACIRGEDSIVSVDSDSNGDSDDRLLSDDDRYDSEIDPLFEALKEDRTDDRTKRLLKRKGKTTLRIFSKTYIAKLYLHVVREDCPTWLQDLAIEINMHHTEKESEIEELVMVNIGEFICRLIPGQFQHRNELGDAYLYSDEKKSSGEAQSNSNEHLGFGIRDLFVWALLSYRLELALIIFNNAWPECDRSSMIGASLTACKILNKLANEVEETSSDKSFKLKTAARQYKHIANYVTSECFKEDRQKTRQMVLRRRPQWGNESFLVISSFLEGKESESFRIVLNDLWSGRLKNSSWLRTKVCWYDISIWEMLVTLWVIGMTLEETRQLLLGCHGNSFKMVILNLWENYTSNWNSLDWSMLITFYIGMGFRFTVAKEDFYLARVFYVISLVLMYFKLLRFTILWQYLGPKVEMIKIMMMQDLPPFLMIFFVFFLSFGIAYQVLLYPNDLFSWNMVWAVISIPYWQLFGYLHLDMVEDTPNCTRNATLANSDPNIMRCPEVEDYPWLVPILIAVFMIMSNILLLNIVIAVFNQTYGEIEEESSKVHRSNHYSLVEEYLARPILPSPLNVIELIIIRPLATILISLYWLCAKPEFQWQYAYNLFKLLMVGKHVDPRLWQLSSHGKRQFKYQQSVTENIEMQLRLLDQTVAHEEQIQLPVVVERQNQREDSVVSAEQMQIFRRLNDTDLKLRQLQDSVDQILTELQELRKSRQNSENSDYNRNDRY
ncbi:transient receptor potential cation channel subfamily M member 2-like [Glandiceps talaboti]